MLSQKRFEDAMKKLTADLDMKQAQREEIKEQQRLKKEGIVLEDGDSDPDGGANDNGVPKEGDDLFGSDNPAVHMNID
jgi:transcription initiation factor TFIID subunit 7